MTTNPIIAEQTFIYIRGGISSKTNKPYLQLSNGRKEFFATISNDLEIDENTFSQYSENDSIDLKVKLMPGSDTVTVLSIV